MLKFFLQDLVRVVSKEYGMKNSYYFITAIMRTIINKSPYLTYQYFTFKESQIRLRSLPRNEVLFVDDLTLALKACFKFDIEKFMNYIELIKIYMMVMKVIKKLYYLNYVEN